MTPIANQNYRVTSDRREPFSIRIVSVHKTCVTGHCFPGGYKGTIPMTSIRGPDDPLGPVFTFKLQDYRNEHLKLIVDNMTIAKPKR